LIALWQLAAGLVQDTLIQPSFLQVLAALGHNWQVILSEDLPISLLHFCLGMAARLLKALPVTYITRFRYASKKNPSAWDLRRAFVRRAPALWAIS
jgi:hypothetical protein